MAKRRKSSGAPKATALAKGASDAEVVEIDDELVNESVKWINDRVVKTIEKGSQGLLEIGQYVFDKFFEGNADNVRFRGRQKLNSFRALADHADLQMGRSSLQNAVNLAIQERVFLGSGSVPDGITATHRIALLAVKDNKDKRKLLSEVVEKKLSVRQLQDRVAELSGKLLPPSTAAPGRKRAGFRMPRAIDQVLKLDTEAWLSERKLARLKPAHVESYREALGKAIERLQEMNKALGKFAKSTV